jgi:hypothetical protein
MEDIELFDLCILGGSIGVTAWIAYTLYKKYKNQSIIDAARVVHS